MVIIGFAIGYIMIHIGIWRYYHSVDKIGRIISIFIIVVSVIFIIGTFFTDFIIKKNRNRMLSASIPVRNVSRWYYPGVILPVKFILLSATKPSCRLMRTDIKKLSAPARAQSASRTDVLLASSGINGGIRIYCINRVTK